MNDRLMMLYQQAHVVDGQMTDKLNVDKFAKLIAKESAKFMDEYADRTGRDLLEYFGVEE